MPKRRRRGKPLDFTVCDDDYIVLVIGSLHATYSLPIAKALDDLPATAILLHAGCKGTDLVVDSLWKQRGGRTIIEKIHWSEYGREALAVRNEEVMSKFNIRLGLIFHCSQDEMKNGCDTRRFLEANGVPT